jgi:hypothetical protein
MNAVFTDTVQGKRTYGNTASTAYAFSLKILDVRMYIPRLGIMAPETAKIAALKKYVCPYTGAVMQRHPLNVKDTHAIRLCASRGRDLRGTAAACMRPRAARKPRRGFRILPHFK